MQNSLGSHYCCNAMVNNHIDSLLRKASNQGVDVHVLEQKHILGQLLTDKEISLRSLLLKLHDIRLDVSAYRPTTIYIIWSLGKSLID